MKILILRSVRSSQESGPFSIRMDTLYADRVIGQLTDKGNYCHACADKCISCRRHYSLDFSESITGIIGFPSHLPAILEDPEEYLPHSVPEHDIVIVIGVNEEILISFFRKYTSAKGVIIPIERSDWISPHAMKEITGILKHTDKEISFPKPFCSFNPPKGILHDFRKKFKIGKPEILFTVKENKIIDTNVLVSAPCGATYFSARGLQDKNVDDNLEYIVDNRISCFPCTADTAVDREFRDSITHQAVKIQRDIIKEI